MKTRTDWPRPRDPNEREPDEVIYFSVFDDVVPLWSVLQPVHPGEVCCAPELLVQQ